ncbi:hypothetical protein CMI47_06735 [Candidatus Pacearchaeota archaeon]|nr:hypothetical protein [Candidatus Pacearchaeota archaeon]
MEMDREKAFDMVEAFMKWTEGNTADTVMETLLFVTVITAKNLNIPAALYLRKLGERWQEIDILLNRDSEVAEA